MKKWGKIGSPKSAKRKRYLKKIRPKGRKKGIKKRTKKYAKHLKGKRRGQSIRYGKGTYVKSGKVHRYSRSRDARRRAKHKRKHGSAKWRGDLPGRRI